MDHRMYTLHHDTNYDHYTSIYNFNTLFVEYICHGWEN
jgi:hypothetical protein